MVQINGFWPCLIMANVWIASGRPYSFWLAAAFLILAASCHMSHQRQMKKFQIVEPKRAGRG